MLIPLSDVPNQTVVVSNCELRIHYFYVSEENLEFLHVSDPRLQLGVTQVKRVAPENIWLVVDVDQRTVLLFGVLGHHKHRRIVFKCIVFKLVGAVLHPKVIDKGRVHKIFQFANSEQSFFSVEVVHHRHFFSVTVQQELFVPNKLLSPQLSLRVLHVDRNKSGHLNQQDNVEEQLKWKTIVNRILFYRAQRYFVLQWHLALVVFYFLSNYTLERTSIGICTLASLFHIITTLSSCSFH